jgi:hypothetical protein
VSDVKSWVKENQTVLGFLIVQAIAIVAYAVKLETRVSTMETRGAEYTVNRMEEMKIRISILEQKIDRNQTSIDRIVETMTKNLSVNPLPGGKP